MNQMYSILPPRCFCAALLLLLQRAQHRHGACRCVKELRRHAAKLSKVISNNLFLSLVNMPVLLTMIIYPRLSVPANNTLQPFPSEHPSS